MLKLTLNIPRQWLTWRRYQWISFLRHTIVGSVIICVIALGIVMAYDMDFQEVFPLNAPYAGFWLMMMPIIAAMEAFLGWGDKSEIYYLRRDRLEEVGKLLADMGYFQSDDTSDRFVFLKRTGWLRYKPAFIYLKQGQVRLELTERYDGLLAPYVLEA